jgi:hypothetical protein
MNELTQIAIRVARQCREVIQTCLREEEWADAEEEFRWLILAGLRELDEQRARGAASS